MVFLKRGYHLKPIHNRMIIGYLGVNMKQKAKISFIILINNIVDESKLLAEHGISFLINIENNGESRYFLMDTGQKPETLIYNARKLNINFCDLKIDAIILSHGHYDHTGGLKGFLETYSQPVPIIGHPDVFVPRISYVGGFRTVSSPFSKTEIKKAGGELLLTRDPIKINDFIITTGEVPRKNKYEINPHFKKISKDSWVNDEVDDDLSLIVHVNKESFFLLCGCCHAGLINTLGWASELTGKKKCYGIMGGFHLVGASKERINFTIDKLKKWKPNIIIPLHCSGMEAMITFKNNFPENTRFLNCGDSFSLNSLEIKGSF